MPTTKLSGHTKASVVPSFECGANFRTSYNYEYQRYNGAKSASSKSVLVSSNMERCKTFHEHYIPRRCSRDYRNHIKTAKNCYVPALICLMIADFLQLSPKLQLLDAFRMVRYSTKRHSAGVRLSESNNRCYTTLFGIQNDVNNQQQNVTTTDPFQATGQDDLFKTLAGGPALIFEMARKSMLFGNKESDSKQPTNTTATTTTAAAAAAATMRPAEPFEQASPPPLVQGRWYPHSGIANVNPNFRTQAPVMTNKGFAKSIWKNARKRNKSSLWKYALRTYDRMALLEGDPNFGEIQRSNIHHEGAMQACAKLGLWQRALEIYHYVYQQEMGEKRQSLRILSPGTSPSTPDQQILKRQQNEREKKSTSVYVTDDMVLSLVRSTVRASRLRSRQKRKSHDPPLSPEQEEQEAALRRIPLDTALEILSTLPEDHSIPLAAYYLNPLAAAYQSLGYTALSKEILETMLSNRTAGEDDILNVHDLCAKDKGSYSLLVQASVVTGDWGSAMDSLSEMTNAGLYPNPRHCNVWSEISERQTRPRAVGSWKKKRDDNWTDSVR